MRSMSSDEIGFVHPGFYFEVNEESLECYKQKSAKTKIQANINNCYEGHELTNYYIPVLFSNLPAYLEIS